MFEFFSDESPDAELAIGVGAGQKAHMRLEDNPFEEAPLVEGQLLGQDESSVIDITFKIRKTVLILLFLLGKVATHIIPRSFLGGPQVIVGLGGFLDPFPDEEVAACVEGVEIFHIVGERGGSDVVAMGL